MKSLTIVIDNPVKLIPLNPKRKPEETDKDFAERQRLGTEAHALYPKGLRKRTGNTFPISDDYESTVRFYKLQEGQEPSFALADLWQAPK